jgi:hypothetical protein
METLASWLTRHWFVEDVYADAPMVSGWAIGGQKRPQYIPIITLIHGSHGGTSEFVCRFAEGRVKHRIVTSTNVYHGLAGAEFPEGNLFPPEE